jgi:hypothetical protein
MDWTTLVVSVVSAVAWPMALVVSVYILRDPLSKAISRLIRVRYKDRAFEAEFQQTLERVKREVEEVLPSNQGAAEAVHARPDSRGKEAWKAWQTTSPHGSFDDLLEMAQVFPEAAVLEAWRELELAMRETIQTADIDYHLEQPVGLLPIETVIRILRGSHPEPHLFGIVDELLALRNKVAHSGGVELSPEKATEYVKLAKRVSDELWRVVGC